ncbi:sec-independent protein translocase protein TatC [Breznakibacter xylanolyticus]|uniref:Sec-independent protein translocase protein TatC n=1 Tax=Breznakibacter xylanolyticus TaxID=990 RepID=A0A2W7P782_9BACT|nr:twin-arginine translocase subunit TatC [Breznakibacter xylanolyticus]PZX19262.1 sec-independent protein translocase protein TatC [Breznakibacter xylanolyticus]
MSNDREMSFWEHVETLRKHLIRSVLAIGILAIAAFIFSDVIFNDVILAPKEPDFFTNRWLCTLAGFMHTPQLCINQNPLPLTNISMSGQFTTHIWVSVIAGFILAFPFICMELWRFIKPALGTNAIKQSSSFILMTSLLFMVGILFGYYIIAPMSIEFLGHYQITADISNQITLTSYISTVSGIVLSSGIAFELPVVIWLLARLGVVDVKGLKKYRRHAMVVIVVFAAIITPPDVVSQILVSVPMILLFEAGIHIASGVERKRS